MDHLYWEEYNSTIGCVERKHGVFIVYCIEIISVTLQIWEWGTVNCIDQSSRLEHFNEGRKETDSEQMWGRLKVCWKSMYLYLNYYTHADEVKTRTPHVERAD